MKLRKVLASILCIAMVLSTMSFTTFAASGVAEINGASYDSLAEALAEACKAEGEVTIELTGDVEWETGAEHGSTPLVPAESKAIVTINGNDNTFTATGSGVGPIRAANDTVLTFNNVNFVDESVSYAENAWEFTYLEFGGKLKFVDCDFEDEIQLDSDVSKFENCTFESNEESVYAVWLGNGIATFDGCYFTGYRGLKMHEAYGTDIASVSVENCKFENITKKPGIAIGDLNDTTSVKISNSEFINVQAGDQGGYIFETDTDVSTFDFESAENSVVSGTITPAYTATNRIWGEATANAVESLVIELYAGETKLAQTSLNNLNDIIDGDVYVTWGIPFNGEDSDYWDVTLFVDRFTANVVPTKAVLIVDGVAVSESAVQMNGPDNLNPVVWPDLDGVYCAAKIGTEGFVTIQDAINSLNGKTGDYTIEVKPGVYDEALSFKQVKNLNVTIEGPADPVALASLTDEQTENRAVLTKTFTIDGNNRGTYAETLTFKNIIFDGSDKTGGYDCVFEKNNTKAHNVTFLNCEFYGTYDYGTNYVRGFKASKGGTKNVVFDGCKSYGLLALLQVSNCTPLTVTNSYIEGGAAIQTTSSTDVTFTNNVVNVEGYVIRTGQNAATTNTKAKITFIGNEIETTGTVLDLRYSTSNVTVEDNEIDAVNVFTSMGSDNTKINETVVADETLLEKLVENDLNKISIKIVVGYEMVEPGLYNIVLTGSDDINEFVAAELTFVNESETVAGEAMQYEILGINGVTNVEKSIEKEDTYALRLVNDANRMTGKKLEIGQVKFHGMGNINFSVSEGTVVATVEGTHLEDYYTVADKSLVAEAITNGAVEEVKRDVVINVAYNHALNNVWADSQIKVTIKDGFGNVKSADITSGVAKFEDVQLGRLTVTLEAPGFRKYVYNTTLEEGSDEDDALVLNFWNNVKRATVEDPEAEIEVGKGLTNKNFLVGDIVMDYIVDEYDLAAVTSYYGMYGIENNDKFLMYDLNRDGNIDIIDVAFVLHTLNN